mmetsp:Transcript_10594/g.20431  ORF Transcript_10594/g.20431 Transcript_10594/m.20431 type:complete len:115 (+) Transcript_10594:2579-2923(+)
MVRSRGFVVGSMLFLSIPLMAILRFAGTEAFVLYVIIATLVGACTGGPANLISTAYSADIAKRGENQHNKKALSTIAGIIDGMGGLGAGIGQLIIGLIAEHSWTGVFLFLMGKV